MIIVLRSVDAKDTSHFTDLAADQVASIVGDGEKIAVHDVADIPTRSELKVLNFLPELVTAPTPSLDEIAAQPDVAPLGEPGPAPHQTSERVRIVVLGSDATLQTVVSKLLRIDALWTELAYVPVISDSGIAVNWALDTDSEAQSGVSFALTAPAQPTPVIRDDHAQVVLGGAEITGPEDGELCGEVIVDSDTLYHHNFGDKSPFTHGVRFVPTMTAPGLAAVQLPSPTQRGEGPWWRKLTSRFRPVAEPTLLQGRALQAGGRDMQIVRDGVPHPRSLKAVTFYRHLRDGQFVRR